MVSLGFIGAGAITDAVVQGLHAAGNAGHAIHLSPRSEARSRALAARYERVVREDSNAAVVAKSDIVFLAVRPQQMPGYDFAPSRRWSASSPVRRSISFARS